MAKLRVVAQGDTDQARANARGKLFERITAEVLRHNGYEIDAHTINVNYAGMEIDVEGVSRIARIPLYAECKCYSADVASEKLQTFYGKYLTRWFKDRRSHGLFVAIPGINSHAMGFYRENCEANREITVHLLQESDVISALVSSNSVIDPSHVKRKVDLASGTAGDNLLICSDLGFFWVQYVIPIGSGIATRIQIFDSLGNPISDARTIEWLSEFVPEIGEAEIVAAPAETESRAIVLDSVADDVVELRGSSACFEYQFPASPQFFVGRTALLSSVDQFISDVIRERTSSRGLLFEANSGWGKSSLVLATVDRIQQAGHYAIAIDSRSASNSQFLLQTVRYVLDKFRDFNGAVPEAPVVTGFEGALDAVLEIGDRLKTQGRLLFIFFDQFENVFHLLDLLTKLTQLGLRVTDSGTGVVLGFSWKRDLVGLTRDFPYRWRDTIIDFCRTVHLKQFSEVETNELLDRLSEELHTPLRKDLRFLLSEFSQGYPWLLKKLCAHVKNQRQAGIAQAELARGLLRVEQLFLEDLEGLSPEQDETLRQVARLAPVGISDLGDELRPDIVQSLVDRRLVVNVGAKYDIYWDIFRDYLNTGKLPIEEIYLLRNQVGSVLRAFGILREAGGTMDVDSFKKRAGLSDGGFLNVARELRLLHIADVQNEMLCLAIPSIGTEEEATHQVRLHLNERLPRNRCVHSVLHHLRQSTEVTLSDLALLLKREFPYISAVDETWDTYARILAHWLDVADLAILDANGSKLSEYKVGSQIRDRSLSFARKRAKTTGPLIHFSPIVQVATRLVTATRTTNRVDWTGIRRSTIYKSLAMLEEMGLIGRQKESILVKPECQAFVHDSGARIRLARTATLLWPVFVDFLSMLQNAPGQLSNSELATMLMERPGCSWTKETAKTNAKIMLDWARHLGLAPGVFAYSIRGQFRSVVAEAPLFDFASSEDEKAIE